MIVDMDDGHLPALGVVVAIPLFKPATDSALAERLAALGLEGVSFVLIDNGGGSGVIERVRTTLASSEVFVIRNEDNLGQAAALNQALALARERSASWVLVLDQDSEPLPELAPVQLAAAGLAGGNLDVAIVGASSERLDQPDFKGLGARMMRRNHRSMSALQAEFRESPVVITSGALVNVPVAIELGGFDERLFIDEVDNEYCMRARARGYRVVLATTPGLRHAIGSTVYRRVPLIGEIASADHAPVRRYYMARNLCVVTRWHWRRDWRWLLHGWRHQVGRVLRIVLFLDDKGAKLSATAEGFRDGLARHVWAPCEHNRFLRPLDE